MYFPLSNLIGEFKCFNITLISSMANFAAVSGCAGRMWKKQKLRYSVIFFVFVFDASE